MAGPSGKRTRVTEESLKTAPLGNGGGGSPSDKSQSADGDDQNSKEHSGDAESQTSGQSQQQESKAGDDGRQTGERDTSQSTSSDLSTEEAAEYDQIKSKYLNLEKGKQHADRKITEQGQELSDSRKREAELGDRVGRLETVLTQMLAGGDQEQDQSRTASYGADFGPDHDEADGGVKTNSKQNGDSPGDQRLKSLEDVVGGIYAQLKQQGATVEEFTTAQKRAEDVIAIRNEFGIDEEAATVILETSKNGDVVALARTLELKTQPAEARRLAREQRERQRESVFQPGTTSTPYEPNAEDTQVMTDRAGKIMEMPDGMGKQRAIEQFLEQNPGNYEILRDASGFHL